MIYITTTYNSSIAWSRIWRRETFILQLASWWPSSMLWMMLRMLSYCVPNSRTINQTYRTICKALPLYLYPYMPLYAQQVYSQVYNQLFTDEEKQKFSTNLNQCVYSRRRKERIIEMADTDQTCDVQGDCAGIRLCSAFIGIVGE